VRFSQKIGKIRQVLPTSQRHENRTTNDTNASHATVTNKTTTLRPRRRRRRCPTSSTSSEALGHAISIGVSRLACPAPRLSACASQLSLNFLYTHSAASASSAGSCAPSLDCMRSEQKSRARCRSRLGRVNLGGLSSGRHFAVSRVSSRGWCSSSAAKSFSSACPTTMRPLMSSGHFGAHL
jgi:hypothetical protein